MRLVFYKPEQIPEIWQYAEPLFRRVIDKAVHGEFDIVDLYRLAREGKIVVCLVWEGDEVVMATAIEFVYYPKATAANVMAMGGRDLKKVLEECFEPVKQFCREAGADWITCSVSRAIERIHKRNGLRTIYRSMRMEL